MVILNYKDIGKRIKDRRKQLGMTQKELAARMNLSEGTISKYESGLLEDASTTRFNQFAEILRAELAWLLNINVSAQSVGKMLNLPVVTKISHIDDSLVYKEIESYEPTPESWLNEGEYFYLRAKGDSMKNARIYDGDLLLIRQQDDVNDGEIAAVLINEQVVLKKVYKNNDTLILQAENPDYPPFVCSGKSDCNIKIIGKLKKTVISF